MRIVLWFASLLASSCGAPELYDRLGLEKTATPAEIRRSYHAQARHSHPDKVDGDQAVKAAAAEKFKQLAEAYEVLMDKQLRANYDRTGAIPDDRAKASANQQSSGEEDDFGFESAKARQQQQQQQRGFGRFYESYDTFEVRLAQGRARRARSMETIRKHLLAPNGTAVRHGLIGFYRVGEEALLKDRLKFPYPFAGWSLGREGSGFWWEDELQTFLVPLGASTNEASELSRHFGLTHTSELPAVAWVRKEAALGFELHRPQSAPSLVEWVYMRLASSLKVINDDHRPAKVWWIDGHSAKPFGSIAPYGGTYSHSSFVSHSWFFWPEETKGTVLGRGAALGEVTISKVGEEHVLRLAPKCVDTNGHCGQWKHKGECERNPGYMGLSCGQSCGQCASWEWLYELQLGSLHQPLACWALPHRNTDECAPVERAMAPHARILPGGGRWPEGGRLLRSREELNALPAATLRWLREAAGAQAAAAFDAARRPPPQPLPSRPPPPPPPPPTRPRPKGEL